jgi:mono/diheme cytochrome c family protein
MLRRGANGAVAALVVSLAWSIAIAPPAAAQVARGDAVRGEKLAQDWCSSCHAVDLRSAQARLDVPSFPSIAQMPSTTSASLQAWLQTPHPRMPNWALTRPQIDDINAYILSLKEAHP